MQIAMATGPYEFKHMDGLRRTVAGDLLHGRQVIRPLRFFVSESRLQWSSRSGCSAHCMICCIWSRFDFKIGHM